MKRRAVLAAPACLLVPGVLDAQETRLGELRWTGTHPSFPTFRGSKVGEFRGDVEVRIAMRADPNRHRPYLAFYRLAAALGSTLVPVTRVYAFRLPSLLAALAKDSAGLAVLKDDMVIRNDGTVMALVTELVTGREIDVVNGPEVKLWRGWAEARVATREERPLLVASYIETLVLDYLAGNVRRTTAVLDSEGASLRLVENGGAFDERPDPSLMDLLLGQLKRTTRFSRRLRTNLLALGRAEADLALHSGSFASWLVPSRPISEMLERRQSLLSLLDARITEQGEPMTLVFP